MMTATIVALAPPLVAWGLSTRPVDARLMAQALEDLSLAEKVGDRQLVRDLQISAHRSIRKSLKLRETARELSRARAVAIFSSIVVACVPVYLKLVPSAAVGTAGLMWMIMWWIYVATTLISWLWVGFVAHRRRKILSSETV